MKIFHLVLVKYIYGFIKSRRCSGHCQKLRAVFQNTPLLLVFFAKRWLLVHCLLSRLLVLSVLLVFRVCLAHVYSAFGLPVIYLFIVPVLFSSFLLIMILDYVLDCCLIRLINFTCIYIHLSSHSVTEINISKCKVVLYWLINPEFCTLLCTSSHSITNELSLNTYGSSVELAKCYGPRVCSKMAQTKLTISNTCAEF